MNDNIALYRGLGAIGFDTICNGHNPPAVATKLHRRLWGRTNRDGRKTFSLRSLGARARRVLSRSRSRPSGAAGRSRRTRSRSWLSGRHRWPRLDAPDRAEELARAEP